MTIAEMNKCIKEIKEIVKIEDSKTRIDVSSKSFDPYREDIIRVQTKINGYNIVIDKFVEKNESK